MKQFIISGMSCAACASRVEKAVSSLEGIEKCSVNLLTNSMQVEGIADASTIIAAVEKAGYGAKIKGDETQKKAKPNTDDMKKMLKRLLLSVFFLIILMYFSMGYMMFKFPIPKFFSQNHLALGMLEMLITIIIMIINYQFFTNGFKNLFKLSPNMDSLIAIGSSVSFLYSVYALFAMSDAIVTGNMQLAMNYMDKFYFETASMILTLITVGKTLEAYSKGKTTNALKGLMDLTPKMATIIRNGVEVTDSVENVKVGDYFIVRAGDLIPVDGEVVDGNGSVDESSITGESIPVDKEIGQNVTSGTILKSGFLRCVAKKVGEDTTLAQIIKMVDDASSSKAPIAKIADKVSGVFVPAVIGIAIVTFIAWIIFGSTVSHALERAVSVLVISCPCALGLATPVAIMVGNGVSARNGILFKTAESLEITGKSKIIAFDKTGTITTGKPVVTDVLPTNGYTNEELLRFAYAVENRSEHPLSKAIVNYANNLNIDLLEVDEFYTLPGYGVKSKIDSGYIYAGNLKYISSITEISDNHQKIIKDYSNAGKTPLLFAFNQEFIGIICVSDTIKQDSIEAIKEIKSMKIKVVMITGDNELTANAISKEVGVDEVYANVLPNEKGEVINNLRKEGLTIMVGDGINDAPALTSADIGMAIGAGSDIAIDAADVVLVNNKLLDVVKALRLSKSTILNIYENLFWAFIYNVLGIPLAAGVFSKILGWELSPMFGAAAMSLSSFCVVCNALRLNLKGRNPKNTNKKLVTSNICIEGMMCGHCEKKVEELIGSITGVKKVTANHKNSSVKIVSNRTIDLAEIKRKLDGSEYKIKNG